MNAPSILTRSKPSRRRFLNEVCPALKSSMPTRMPSDFIVPITAQVASISTSADVSVISTISGVPGAS